LHGKHVLAHLNMYLLIVVIVPVLAMSLERFLDIGKWAFSALAFFFITIKVMT